MIVYVDAQWEQHPELRKLRDAGHTVFPLDWPTPGPDLVLSSKVWNWNDTMWPYLSVALKAAKRAAPPKPKKTQKKKPA